MKFLVASLCVSHALAFSLDTRSPALISRQAAADLTSSIAAIQSATQSLNTAISSGDLLALASGNSAVVNAIKAATSEANGLSTLSFNDAAGLANPIQDLGKVVDSTITNLISKASSLAGVREAVLAGLTDQQSASMAFSQALLSKVPANLQTIAQDLAQPIANSLNRGIAAYSRPSTIQAPAPTGRPVTQIADGQIQAPTASVQPSIQPSVQPSAAAPQSTPAPTPTPVASDIPKPSPNIDNINNNKNNNGGGGYTMPKVTTITGIPSYSLPGSTPTASAPAVYTGAAAPLAQAGMGAFAVVAAAVVAAAL